MLILVPGKIHSPFAYLVRVKLIYGNASFFFFFFEVISSAR